jgi:hypothetical protein
LIWRGLTEAFEDENYFPGAFQVLGEKSAVAKGNSPTRLGRIADLYRTNGAVKETY